MRKFFLIIIFYNVCNPENDTILSTKIWKSWLLDITLDDHLGLETEDDSNLHEWNINFDKKNDFPLKITKYLEIFHNRFKNMKYILKNVQCWRIFLISNFHMNEFSLQDANVNLEGCAEHWRVLYLKTHFKDLLHDSSRK